MCNACHNVCCGSDMFEGCGCDGCDCEACWSDDDEFEGDDCDHDDYKLDILTSRASCTACDHRWYMPVYVGVDLASGPDQTAYQCSRCHDVYGSPEQAEGCRDPNCPMLAIRDFGETL